MDKECLLTLSRNETNGKISLYWYIGSLRTLTSTYTTAPTIKQVVRKVFVSFFFNRTYSIIINKYDLTKDNARIKTG